MRLARFLYIDSYYLFIRTWQHTLQVLEEDLAVGLMYKLLFTPLFHDKSLVGRLLSFWFRSTRIGIGLIAYFFATLILIFIALAWYLWPVFLIFSQTRFLGLSIFLFGLALFIDKVLAFPKNQLWHIKSPEDIWDATKLKKAEISWEKLTQSYPVEKLLESLEVRKEHFINFNPVYNESLNQRILDLAKFSRAKYIDQTHIWVVMLEQIPTLATALLSFTLKKEDFINTLKFLQEKKNKWRKVFIWDEEFNITHLKGVNRGWLGAPTPSLDQVALDLTKEASKARFPDFIGREKIVLDIVNILSQNSDRNVCLVGEPGSGRSSLVKYLAKKIIAGDAPETLATKRLVELDLGRLIAGIKSEGEMAERIKEIFEEAEFVENIIFFIDEVQNLYLGDAGGSFNLYSLLLPHLESNKLQFIASTESSNYSKIIEKQSFFARVFTKVEVPPASQEETLDIIIQRVIEIERYQKIRFNYLALKEIINLTKVIHDRVAPDNALFILNEAIPANKNGLVDSLVIKEIVSRRVNIPILELDSTKKEKLLNLEEEIHQGFIDQEEAVKAVVDSLRRSATSLREENRPISSFLFIGPTGVGKTELAKRLSEVYFSKDEAQGSAPFFRFDMSEYQTPDSVSRLIGGSDGQLGQLTEAVKNKPYCLILLDEFEKANSKILTIFLQVLDDGRLTDSSGKTIDFTNTIIIATSNVGSLLIAEGLKQGKSLKKLESQVRIELLKTFSPELYNRFDNIVMFKPLTSGDLEKVVNLKLKALKNKLEEDGYLINFDQSLVKFLAEKGFDTVMGARPMRRLIQDLLETNLSKMILEGKLNKGEKVLVGQEYLA